MKKWIVIFLTISVLFNSCKEEVESVPECENCLQFTDPQGVKRTFTIYSKELSDNTGYFDTATGKQVPNTKLNLYFSESPTSIIGITLYTNVPFDFKRNYTSTGKVDYLPGGNISGAYNKSIVVFWDGGNTAAYSYLALKSDFRVENYSYSENVFDQHIIKGELDLVFERSDSSQTIPSFGVNRAEINKAFLNIKF
ncbi:MAG: hypothetical protein GC181_15865 [Bacteroidetes bacterium]|nr:hypothetical protein [Bacteroidota bacterium]